MSQQHTDTYRPSSFSNRYSLQSSYSPSNNANHNHNRDTHRSNSYRPNHNRNSSYRSNSHQTSNRPKNGPPSGFWESQDDQIAPSNASVSISSLQRWALATASYPQQGLGRREDMVTERIERRYGSGTLGPRYTNFIAGESGRNGQDEGEGYERVSMHKKRDRDEISPPQVSRDTRGMSAVAAMRDAKKRRVVDLTGDGEVVDLTNEDEEEEVDYTQSSEWSFPGSSQTQDEMQAKSDLI